MNTFISPEFIHQMGWTLVHAVWQIALVTCIYIFAKTVIRLNPQTRYSLLATAMLVILGWTTHTFISLSVETQFEPTIDSTVYSVNPVGTDYLVTPGWKHMSAQSFFSFTGWVQTQLPWIVMGWMLGALLLGIRFASGYAYLRRLRHQHRIAIPDEWQVKYEELARRMGIKKKVPLWISQAISEPLTLGHFKPIILIPVGMLNGLSPEQVEGILAHELAHVQRADFLVNTIQSLFEILFFFHPAIWWLSNEMRREREMCCDDLAVKYSQGALTYASALTEVSRQRFNTSPYLTIHAGGEKKHFTSRIHRLFSATDARPGRFGRKLLTTLIVFAGMGMMSQMNKPAQTESVSNIIEIRPGKVYWKITPETRLVQLIEGIKLYNEQGFFALLERHKYENGRLVDLTMTINTKDEEDSYMRYTLDGFEWLEIDYDENRAKKSTLKASAAHTHVSLLDKVDIIIDEKMTYNELMDRKEALRQQKIEPKFINVSLNKDGFITSAVLDKIAFSGIDHEVQESVGPRTRMRFYLDQHNPLPLFHLSMVELATSKDSEDAEKDMSMENLTVKQKVRKIEKVLGAIESKTKYYAIDGEIKGQYHETVGELMKNLALDGSLTSLGAMHFISGEEAENAFGIQAGEVVHFLSDEYEEAHFNKRKRMLHELDSLLQAEEQYHPLVELDGKRYEWEDFKRLNYSPQDGFFMIFFEGEKALNRYGVERALFIQSRERNQASTHFIKENKSIQIKQIEYSELGNYAQLPVLIEGQQVDWDQVDKLKSNDISRIQLLDNGRGNKAISINLSGSRRVKGKTEIKPQEDPPMPLVILNGEKFQWKDFVALNIQPKDVASLNIISKQKAIEEYGVEKVFIIQTKTGTHPNKPLIATAQNTNKVDYGTLSYEQLNSFRQYQFFIDDRPATYEDVEKLSPQQIELIRMSRGEMVERVYGKVKGPGLVFIKTKTGDFWNPVAVYQLRWTNFIDRDEIEISFQLPSEGKARLYIRNMQGKTVKRLVNKELNTGKHVYTWNQNHHANGMYLIMLEHQGQLITHKYLVSR